MLRIKNNTKTQNKHVPLKQVNIDAIIQSFAADVKITQIFRNVETTPIEVVYCFPIEEQAAIYSFIAHIDDREIVAQLKEKQTAQKEYNEALQQGHGAYLLEQDEKSQDIFIINIGALPVGKICQITISYVTELDLVENGTKIRFVIPTTIAPRYNPVTSSISSPANTTSKYVQSSPYTINFQCQIEKRDVSCISSISHPIEVELGKIQSYMVKFARQNTHLDRDIILDIELAENRSNTIVAVEPGAIMTSFTPTKKDCQAIFDTSETTNEFIFIVDCSGSMKDKNKIGLARQAMLLFLKSLPLDCHFNLIRFGTTYKVLFHKITAIYNEKNVRKAIDLIKTMQADLGGTELLCPLEWLQKNPSSQGRTRQIFLLTDGEISNVNEVLDLCRTMVTSTHIFSFGLGSSPSRSLVKGLARTTNGHFVFIPPNTNVDVYVGEQLQRALQSCIANVQVKWNLNVTLAASIPTKIPPVYINDRLIVYALLKDKSISFDHNSTVALKTEQHHLAEAKVIRIPSISNNEMIARLAAKALILELLHSKLPSSNDENINGSIQNRFQMYQEKRISNNTDEMRKKMLKERIIELSLKYNILSPYTAFIGIEKRSNATNKNMVLHEVSIQISTDDEYLQFSSQTNDSNLLNRKCFYYMIDHSRSFSTSATGISAHSDTSTDDDDDNHDQLCSYSYQRSRALHFTSVCSSYRSYHSSLTSSSITFDDINEQIKTDPWPTDDQDIVRHLINKQKFDGSWDLDTESIEHLTGKPLNVFQQTKNDQVLITAIIVSLLETRFGSFLSMWHGIVQKARQYLLNFLNNDMKNLDSLLENIRQQL